MRDMMTAFFAELGGGETALSGTGPGGELDLQELTTDGHRPPWTPTSVSQVEELMIQRDLSRN